MATQTLTRLVDERWERKLYNWALWKIGRAFVAESTAYADLDEEKIRDAWKTYTPPTPEPQALIGEAMDTNELVVALDDELQRAVTAQYCWLGSMQERARELGCHPDTLYSRITRAKIELDRLDWKRRLAAVKPPQQEKDAVLR